MITPISQSHPSPAAPPQRLDATVLRDTPSTPAVAVPETARAVAPLGETVRGLATRANRDTDPALPPPDPDAPTGPPPAFDSSPLEKQRREQLAPKFETEIAPDPAPGLGEDILAPKIDIIR